MKYLTLAILILFLTSCHRGVIEFDRTYRMTNSTDYDIYIQSFNIPTEIIKTYSINGKGIIFEETKLAVDGSIAPASILGTQLEIIFDDSLILIHNAGLRDTDDFNPPDININILNNEAWTRVSNELYTYEITEELLSQAVPVED